ncbi:MAG: hypothetical protein JST87_05320 [Bacteroidetes bacterium]|nr:hypothetical protein [Bacteroidota bacterium]
MPNAKNIEKHKFKKGQSGNPKGRPARLPELDFLLAKVLGEDSAGITAAEEILKSLYRKAIKGDTKAAEILLDRGWGKVKQNMELSSNADHPLIPPVIKIIQDDGNQVIQKAN